MSAQEPDDSQTLKETVNRLWETWAGEGMFQLDGGP